MFVSLRDMHAPTQEQFDEWHRSACLELATIYNDGGCPSFFVGQAQKWLNMTFKYIYVLGDERIPGFGHLYDLCHVPQGSDCCNALLWINLCNVRGAAWPTTIRILIGNAGCAAASRVLRST
jgi:hypothetical protein